MAVWFGWASTTKQVIRTTIPSPPLQRTSKRGGVPPGVYAIETYQDVNCNDKMDPTGLGLPLEPYGFSNDAHPVLSKPRFSKVKFTLHAGEQSQILHLQNGVAVVASK